MAQAMEENDLEKVKAEVKALIQEEESDLKKNDPPGLSTAASDSKPAETKAGESAETKVGEDGKSADAKAPAKEPWKPKGDPDDPNCWDFVKTGSCWKGDACPWKHPAPDAPKGADGEVLDVRFQATEKLLAEAEAQFDALAKSECDLKVVDVEAYNQRCLTAAKVNSGLTPVKAATAEPSESKGEYFKPWAGKETWERFFPMGGRSAAAKRKKRKGEGKGEDGATSDGPAAKKAKKDTSDKKESPALKQILCNVLNPLTETTSESELKAKLLERANKFKGW